MTKPATEVAVREEDGNVDRHAAVSAFFSDNRAAWLDRYHSNSFDASNYRRRADVALEFLAAVRRGYEARRVDRPANQPVVNQSVGRARRGLDSWDSVSSEPGESVASTTMHLLEVGCGAGVQASASVRAGWRVTATDLTVPLLQQAKAEFQGPNWVAATAEDLPFGRGSFHAALMLGVIGYVNDPRKVLRSVHEVLDANGSLVISWARDHTLLETASRSVSAVPDKVYLTAKRMLRRSNSKSVATEQPSFYQAYNRFWDRGRFTQLLESTGFRVTRVCGVNFGKFRFMDRSLWPEQGDTLLSSGFERLSNIRGFTSIGQFARTHIALAERM